jgi:hypothetical protein
MHLEKKSETTDQANHKGLVELVSLSLPALLPFPLLPHPGLPLPLLPGSENKVAGEGLESYHKTAEEEKSRPQGEEE